MRTKLLLSALLVGWLQGNGQAVPDSLPKQVDLEQAIAFSLKNQPLVQQSEIDEKITAANIRNRLADWYPQVNFNYNLQHNFVVQTNIIGGNPVKLGVDNVSALQFTMSQTLFNRDVLLARRTRTDVQQQALQTTRQRKIDLVVAVSKAYYDVLATTQQVKVADENIRRIERSLQDAKFQYDAGVADKTDFKRATIALNNAKASRIANEEILKAKQEYLKSLMGYPVETPIELLYDSASLEQSITAPADENPELNNRIEYQLLTTQIKLQEANLKYNKWAYLPNVSLNGAYNLNYLNNQFAKLYNVNYPASFAAITLGFPIFQGGKRKSAIDAAEWQLERTKLDLLSLKNSVNAAYSQAIATYKSTYTNYLALKENLDLAREVYDVIQLQYRNGIKTYLEVINAETDLRTATINYYTALYNVLASKVDVQKELGQFNY
ncbi:TolC family protein [Flavihumibacter sp. RY-1]|uniref:TolC family protein n=1 Tax=Flavihumibacter fluminis TaxID=2909236 RepID=A0ABS9BPI7_9BACT|nr:TolC family protein [Flavihumibacter fluminis]MCF1716739.1 TolC family protein [Flavihumibacter fluminis]